MKIGHTKGGQRLVSNMTDRISQISLWKADWRARLKNAGRSTAKLPNSRKYVRNRRKTVI